MYHSSIPRDARGRVRPDLRAQAFRDWQTLPVEGGYVWRSLGPAQGLDEGGSPPPPVPPRAGGLVADLAVGASPSHVVIVTRNGGPWRTTDFGTVPEPHWQALGDNLPSLQTVTITMVDSGAGEPILLAATGDLNNEQIRQTGLVGLYRSVDGGKTWSVADGGLDATLFHSHDANQVVAIDADRILLATRIGLYFSKDGGRSFGNDADHRNGRPMLRGPVSAVVVDGTEVAAVIGGEPVARAELYPPEVEWQARTPLGDAGLWIAQLTASGLAAFTLAHATLSLVTDDNVGHSTFDRRGNFWLLSAARREVVLDTLAELRALRDPANPNRFPHHSVQFHSGAPATGTWHRLPSQPARPLQASYVHCVALEPLRSGRSGPDAWFGSIELMRAPISKTAGVFNWTPTERGTDGTIHVDEHVLHVIPQGAGAVQLLVGNDGGIYSTTDAGVTWTAANHHSSIMFWTLIAARKDATRLRLLGGLQDNGSVVGEGPLSPAAPTDWQWQKVADGDGGALAWVPSAADKTPVQDPGTAFVTGSGFLFNTSGTTVGGWTTGLEFGPTPEGFPFSEGVAIARGATGEWDRHYFAASERRYGPGIVHARNGTGSFVAKRTFNAMVTALAAAPADPATELSTPPGEWRHLWVGLANGEVWFSQDAGDTFFPQAVAGTGPVTGIAVDPDDSRRVAVVYGGFSDRGRSQTSAKVFLTEDGATFRDISGRRGPDGFVPDLPVLAVTFARTLPVALIVSTDLGVLITSGPPPGQSGPQLGDKWSRLGAGLPTMYCPAVAAVNPPPADPRTALTAGLPPIAIGSFGRGAWLLARPAAAEAVIEFDGGFGALAVGGEEQRTLTVRNPGGAALAITGPTAPAPFSFQGLPAGAIQAPARGSISWTVVCRPTAAGNQIANLSLTLGGTPRQVPVSCEAVASGRPRLAFWPRIVNFGEAPDGQNVDETIHLKNTGAGDLHISGITAGAGASPRLSLTPAVPPALTLTPGQERTLTLRFAAAGRGSRHETTWTIASDDPIADPEHFQLNATGTVGEPLPTPPPPPPPPAPAHGTPLWVWFAVAGGAAVVGAVVVIIYYETRDDSSGG